MGNIIYYALKEDSPIGILKGTKVRHIKDLEGERKLVRIVGTNKKVKLFSSNLENW